MISAQRLAILQRLNKTDQISEIEGKRLYKQRDSLYDMRLDGFRSTKVSLQFTRCDFEM